MAAKARAPRKVWTLRPVVVAVSTILLSTPCNSHRGACAMSTQANAKASDRNVHPGQHDRVDHDDGNDDRGPLGGWGHNVHRGMDLFDHRHGWQEPEGGHHHHHGPENAPAPADGLIAVIGGSAVAAGESSAATGFIENFAEH